MRESILNPTILIGPETVGGTIYLRVHAAAADWIAYDILPGGTPANRRIVRQPPSRANWRTSSDA